MNSEINSHSFNFAGQVFVSVSLGLSLNYATIPLFYELSVEILYPAHEVLVGGVVTAFDSITTSAFLLIYSLRTIGKNLFG